MANILRDFENRLEGAVEGFFARLFKSGLQPVELAKAVQRYAANYQQVGVDGVFVPNVYRFALNETDLQRFSGFADSLETELAAVVRRGAKERGWRLQGRVRIELVPDESVREGTYEVRGKIESTSAAPPRREPVPPVPPTPQAPMAPPAAPSVSPVPQPAFDAGGDGATRVLPAADQGGRAALHLIGGDRARFALSGTMTLGRLPQCDITLDDASVSRRHARIQRSGERWSIEDLGSTNGVRVNGEDVGHAEIRDGDQLELGSVRMLFVTDG
ncbi:MAG TPA: DUF3662 and FHA domain-containing protein [Egibacteraceae bacterium]|nr:DUF3662 and FHA domain-containing protein [Egibacteraceae bacterium]